MARPQTQLPGVGLPQPQARPTDQFVQTKPEYKVPKQYLELAKFSQTWTNLIAQSQQDAHERSFAQGQMDATYAVPFGSSTAQTPEMEANRKAFKAEQENGKILPSEDPWYRIGLYTGEGRRASLTMYQALTSDENIRAVSRVYDDKGEFIPFEKRENENAIFDRQSAIFLQTPALQSIYGKQAAAKMVEAARAEFVAKVAHARDAQAQVYHETQLADQTVEQLDRVALAAPDQSPEGLARTEEAKEGLHDLIAEWTVKWNLPDGPKVARNGFLAFIDKGAQTSPMEAVEAIDLVRNVKVGPTAVGADNSEDGVTFRAKLDSLEAHYRYAASVETERQNENAKAYKTAYLSRVEDGVSEGFARGLPPSAVYDKLKARIENEVEPRFQDEAKTLLDAHYSDALKPKPRDTQKDEELDFRVVYQHPDEIAEWIKGLDVSYGQKSDMQKKLQAEVEGWKGLPEVKAANDVFEADRKDFVADRAKGIQDDFRDLTNSEVAGANQRIRLQAMKLTGEQRTEKMGGIVEAEYAKATAVLKAFKADIHTRSVAFDSQLLAASNKGVNFEADIIRARDAGLITRGELNTAVEKNQKASDISHYTEDPRVKGVLASLYPTTEIASINLSGMDYNKIQAANSRAFELAQEWGMNERGNYDSPRAADNAFSGWIVNKLRPEMAKALDIPGSEKPIGASAKPGGPSFSEEDRATEGKSFQTILDTGSAETLKLAAAKAYPLPKVKRVPQSLTKFQENFGQPNGQMQKIRADARKEIGTLASYDDATAALLKPALLNAGVATPGEILKGEMDIGGVKVPILPGEIDPWKAMAFQSTAQFVNACSGDPDTVYSLAEKLRVTRDDFEPWVKQQGLLLKRNGL